MDAKRVVEEFRNRFGSDPKLTGIAPGRVNLIGEHTDYNDGFVFPAAINHGLYIAASPNHGPACRLFSLEMKDGEGFDARTVEPPASESWSKYPAGMAWALRDAGQLGNFDAVIGSDIPIGSGVSSSAAIELAFGVIWNELAGLGLKNKELALRGQKCENGFIGLQSGIMDQMASAMGKKGSAMFLDTRTLDITYAPIPNELVIAICDTCHSRELAGSEYNKRRHDCEEAARILGVPKLRDASLSDLDDKKAEMDNVVFRRARHIITENQRCRDFVPALESANEAQIGDLMRASHASLRDDYEVTGPELDAMSEAANAATGCVGARMTGGGFGGACVALVKRERFDTFKAEVESAYEKAMQHHGSVIKCEAADGARLLG